MPALSPAISSSSWTRSMSWSMRRAAPCFSSTRLATAIAFGSGCPRSAGADHREEDSLFCDRRGSSSEGHRDGPADQHHHADLLLRYLGRAASRGCNRADQEGDREDLRKTGRGG